MICDTADEKTIAHYSTESGRLLRIQLRNVRQQSAVYVDYASLSRFLMRILFTRNFMFTSASLLHLINSNSLSCINFLDRMDHIELMIVCCLTLCAFDAATNLAAPRSMSQGLETFFFYKTSNLTGIFLLVSRSYVSGRSSLGRIIGL